MIAHANRCPALLCSCVIASRKMVRCRPSAGEVQLLAPLGHLQRKHWCSTVASIGSLTNVGLPCTTCCGYPTRYAVCSCFPPDDTLTRSLPLWENRRLPLTDRRLPTLRNISLVALYAALTLHPYSAHATSTQCQRTWITGGCRTSNRCYLIPWSRSFLSWT